MTDYRLPLTDYRLLFAWRGRRWRPIFGHLRPFAKEELFHLFKQKFVGARISHIEAVMVDEDG